MTAEQGPVLVVATRLVPLDEAARRRTLELSAGVASALASTEGFVGGRLRVEDAGTLWSVTLWASASALAAFRSGHEPVVDRRDLDTASVTVLSWRQRGEAVPTWEQVALRCVRCTPPGPGVSLPVRPGLDVRRVPSP